jgi:hypothetical protein
MRRLREQQIVEIHLETDDPAMTCRVASVTGAVATLMLEQQPEEPLPPASTGHLVFEHHGSLVALRGIAASLSTDEPKIEFVVVDNVVLPERRAAERIPLAATVRLSAVAGENDQTPSITTITADISITGALVERRAGLGSQALAMEIRFDADPTPITCRAQPVRDTPTHVGMKFVDMPEADRARLAGIIFRYQRAALRPNPSQGLMTTHR